MRIKLIGNYVISQMMLRRICQKIGLKILMISLGITKETIQMMSRRIEKDVFGGH